MNKPVETGPLSANDKKLAAKLATALGWIVTNLREAKMYEDMREVGELMDKLDEEMT